MCVLKWSSLFVSESTTVCLYESVWERECTCVFTKERGEGESAWKREGGGECDDKCNFHSSGDLESETRTHYERH